MSQRAESPLATPSVANIGSDFMKLNVDIATASGWLERDWLDVAVIKLEDVETPFGIVRRVLQLLL